MSPGSSDPIVPKITSIGQTGTGHLALASQLLRDGRYAEVLKSVEESLHQQPDVGQAHFLRAVALLKLEDPVGARASLLEALRLDEGLSAAWLNLAHLERDAGDLEAALRAVERATGASEPIASAFLVQGEILRALERDEQAVAAFRRAVELEPGFSRARRSLSETLVELGRADEARAELEAATRQNPGDAAARLDLGDLLAAAGELEAAAELYKKASSLDQSRFSVAYAKMGEVYLQLGWVEEGFMAARVAVRSAPRQSVGYLVLARAYAALGHSREAVETCHTALRFDAGCQAARDLLDELSG